MDIYNKHVLVIVNVQGFEDDIIKWWDVTRHTMEEIIDITIRLANITVISQAYQVATCKTDNLFNIPPPFSSIPMYMQCADGLYMCSVVSCKLYTDISQAVV